MECKPGWPIGPLAHVRAGPDSKFTAHASTGPGWPSPAVCIGPSGLGRTGPVHLTPLVLLISITEVFFKNLEFSNYS